MSGTATILIEGMHCAACVGRVERALKAMPGVEDAAVSLVSGKAQVRFGASPDLAGVGDALRKAGYPMGVADAALTVEGMTCASCVGRVERALAAVPGVLSASVNLAMGEARVHYALGAVTPTELAGIVTRAGYTARPKAGQDDSPSLRQEAEARALARRFAQALALGLPVVVLAMVPHAVPSLHHWLMGAPQAVFAINLIQCVLTLALLAGPGRVFLAHGIPALLRGAPEMNSLVALGALAAVVFSMIATFAPDLLPAGSRGVYYEAAASIVTLILLGRMLEARARGRAGQAIARLMDLRPDTALVLRGADLAEIPAAELVAGDLVRLRPGERVATDGVVTEGASHVDEAMLTGEPLPVAKVEGDALTGGTVNGTGTMIYRVTATGSQTVLARIIRMVDEAQATKLPVQALVDRITLWFVPAVMAVAALTVLVWSLAGPEPRLTHALVAGISVLIIACPCAMGLATPVSVLVGSGRGAELGILFRKGDALQSLSRVRTVAFDKTGTLTEGHPALVALTPAPGWSEADALRFAASAEAGSEHPLARAVLKAASDAGLSLAPAEAGQALPGLGYKARIEGRPVLVGSLAALEAEGIVAGELAQAGERAAADGQTAVYLAVDGQPAALMTVADRVRPTSATAIAELERAGIATVMISGDSPRTARTVADGLGIRTVIAGVRPEGKVDALKALPAPPVAFVGDGLNDAPALAAADVGLAMGGGSDLARETADVVIMRGDPALVGAAIGLSRATLANIRQNLFWAFGYNVVLIPVAAGALYPSHGLMLSPMLASAAMALSSVFVVMNALRLRRFRP